MVKNEIFVNIYKGETTLKLESVHKLIPGMVVGKDVYAHNNLLLVPRGALLNDSLISNLKLNSILSIHIEEEKIKTPAEHKVINNTSPNTKRRHPVSQTSIKSSKEFKVFKKNYENSINVMSNKINDFIAGTAPLDVASLLDQTTSLFTADMSKYNLFDMLHHMRDYDDSTFVHCINVALICNAFGRWLNLDDYELETLTLCGLLHDIGKLDIPDEIIKKPNKLTDEEYEIIKQHPYKGYQILSKQKMDPRIAQAALLHHERCDGLGYPLGFDSSKIIDFAKIVSIADVYDAMTSPRVYRQALCPFYVIKHIESEGVQKYDPHFFLTFMEQILQTYINCNVRLSNGQVGTVIFINKNDLAYPVVNIDGTCIDLSINKDIEIDAII